jgi:colanic acid/amylovoran biosynthesis glycosyltransferase
MRVLYFVSLFPCWSETFIVREIQALLRQGVDVRIVSLKHASEKLVQSDAQALLDRVIYPQPAVRGTAAALWQCIRHPLREARNLWQIVSHFSARPEAMVKTLGSWWRTVALMPALHELRPDHVHAHWATYPSTAAMFAAEALRVPFSFTAHAHDIFLEDHLLARKIDRCAFGVAISEFNRRYLAEKATPLAREKMQVIHCGVSPKTFGFQAEGRSPGRLLAVGRHDEIKGFAHLIDACALLAQQGVAFECDVIGDGPLRPALQQKIDAAGLGERVRLLGARKQEEVREALLRSSIFVLPSVVTTRGDRDGIPVALMEAMAVGAPVVSTRVSGIPELVEHERTGLIAEPGNAQDLARQLSRLLADPDLGRKLAAAARTKVEQEFDVDIEAGKLRRAIEQHRTSAPGRPVRLLIVTDEMEVGGTQRQIVNIVTGLDRAKFDVTVLYFRNSSFLVDQLRDAGIKVLELGKRSRLDWRFIRRLREAIRQGDFDVMHCFSYSGEAWGALASRGLPRAPIMITSVRGTYEWYTRLNWTVKRWVTRRSYRVVANSSAGATYAREHLGSGQLAIDVIPNGVESQAADAATARQLRAALDGPDASVLVLFVGRLIPDKDVATLIRAVKRLADDGVAVRLAVVGDGPHRAELEQLIASNDLRGQVTLLGERTDSPELIAAADLVVLPSLREGLSNVILEAMMAGKPVIASRVGGNPELVMHERTGLLFKVGDDADLATALRRLAQDEGLRHQLGAAAQERAQRDFSMTALAGAYGRLYLQAARLG